MIRHRYLAELNLLSAARRVGRVRELAANHVQSTGPLCSIGDVCDIETEYGAIPAEVAAVGADQITLVPLDTTASIAPNARVVARGSRNLAPVGDGFAGRLVDALGEPLDGGACIAADAMAPVAGAVLSPMARRDPDKILETGIRAIDGLLSIGVGQRLGIFSASGVGKTTLVRQLAQQVAGRRCIICLVGERGREVESIWSSLTSLSSPERYTCVAATSDCSPVLRARAAHQALCLAECWRERGEDVVLILDSATRYAMALREIGLAAGAPPTLRAYPPGVFAALPRLVERAGAAVAGGSITAIFTVLSETDDVDDPIAEAMKSLLDGHIILSRHLAEQGHFPPIDITKSVSRQAERIMRPTHARAARHVASLLAIYDEARVMLESGLYKSGASPRLDEAVRERDAVLELLKQNWQERAGLGETVARLEALAARRSSRG